MKQVTPTHMAIQAIDETIRDLKLRRAELAATLPKRKKHTGPMYFTNPLTGKKTLVKNRR
ncbi:MAG: hypothetical protein GY710_09385 [Desulfobacteraceae bacterium]|nr:hypothetical protein [Desulfobacteraceae bacterium]